MPGMMEQKVQLLGQETGRVIVARLEVASSLWTQTVGLMGRREFAADSGLWIPHCNGIHTAFVRFPIDVMFLDGQMRAVRLVPALSPWRVVGPVRGAKSVVELPAGSLRQKQIVVGQQFLVTIPDGEPPGRQP